LMSEGGCGLGLSSEGGQTRYKNSSGWWCLTLHPTNSIINDSYLVYIYTFTQPHHQSCLRLHTNDPNLLLADQLHPLLPMLPRNDLTRVAHSYLTPHTITKATDLLPHHLTRLLPYSQAREPHLHLLLPHTQLDHHSTHPYLPLQGSKTFKDDQSHTLPLSLLLQVQNHQNTPTYPPN
jgi:hypothetical protein